MQAVEQVRASSNRVFALKAKNWFDCAHCFFKLCAESGNAEACYTLDMVLLSAEQEQRSFVNGEGGDCFSRGGTALAGGDPVQRQRRIQDRQGLTRWGSVIRTRRLPRPRRRLERAQPLPPGRIQRPPRLHRRPPFPSSGGRQGARLPVRGSSGEKVYERVVIGAEEREMGCARTRSVGGRRLAGVCGKVKYCSHTCQALDGKRRHKEECGPTEEDGNAGVHGVEFLGVDGGS